MPNKIQITSLKSTDGFVSKSSRYAASTILYYGDKNYLTFQTYKKDAIKISDADKYKVISSGEEFRPDLVSYKAYGIPDFWWRIMEANGIKDVFDFKAGLNIRIPSAIF